VTRALLAIVALVAAVSCAFGAASPAMRVTTASTQCGAVKVGPRLLLTAGHCVEWKTGVNAQTVPLDMWLTTARAFVPGRSVRVSRADDLAWLELDDGDTMPAITHMREGVQGEEVFAVAPVYGWTQHDGRLTRRAFQGDRGSVYWETTLTVAPGWSGSPVIARSDGALVGVVSSCHGQLKWVGRKLEKSCKPGFSVVAGAHQ